MIVYYNVGLTVYESLIVGVITAIAISFLYYKLKERKELKK